MGRPAYSGDLRALVVAEVASGSSRRAAARRFQVSVSSAIRWVELHARTGSVGPRRRGGRSRSPLEPHAAWLLALLAKEPDLTLAALAQRVLAELGLRTSESSLDRFFGRHKIGFKKKPARGRTGQARRGRGAGGLEGRPGVA